MGAANHAVDRLVLAPADIDLARSPLRGQFDADTFVLGAFNPGMTRLPNGNLLLMVRIAEALREPVRNGSVHAIRWSADGYALDAWPVDRVDVTDPRKFLIKGQPWKVMALTSLSWLLPVEMTPDGLDIVAIHYDRAIAPAADSQCYGVEDARISSVEGGWLMTTCSVSPERHATTLYASDDGLQWRCDGIVLDHQNKDMLIFEGRIDGAFWAQTRPLGDLYFAYPPGSEWRAGPSINLSSSPDGRHWKPCSRPGIRPLSATTDTARMGGGTPPILTDIAGQRGWLTLWHGVEPSGVVGIYRTYWSLLHPDEPWRVLATGHAPLLEPDAALTEPLGDARYLADVVFTTGIADAGDHFVVASGADDLACRITHVAKDAFKPG